MTFIDEAISQAQIGDKIAHVILSCLFRDGIPQKDMGPIVAKLLMQEIDPRRIAEETEWEDLEYYHYGFKDLLGDIAACLYTKALQPRHAKKIIEDCWHKYCGYDLTQYLIETKLLDEVEGDALLTIVREAMAANPKACEQFKAGKEKAVGAVVGAVMKKQKADPITIQAIIKTELGMT